MALFLSLATPFILFDSGVSIPSIPLHTHIAIVYPPRDVDLLMDALSLLLTYRSCPWISGKGFKSNDIQLSHRFSPLLHHHHDIPRNLQFLIHQWFPRPQTGEEGLPWDLQDIPSRQIPSLRKRIRRRAVQTHSRGLWHWNLEKSWRSWRSWKILKNLESDSLSRPMTLSRTRRKQNPLISMDTTACPVIMIRSAPHRTTPCGWMI